MAVPQAAAKVMNPAFNPRTVHFWAPILKWGVVIAGISDFYRPVEQLSVSQNAALTATGSIWTRWCMIIQPKNYPLAAVNFFLAGVGTVQLSRIALHYRNLKKDQKEKVVPKTM
ncbi:mitochondrial pyruvate carrier [Geopyxis carbonaria]|nr:mitochondrial pyruvate carrier [Geopyxis carbonaria]